MKPAMQSVPAPAANHWHALSGQESLARLGAAARGLARETVAKRLAQFGPNALPETKHRSLWRVFFRQFASPLIYILFVAAALAFAMGKRGDAGVILIVVLVNAVIGAFQEGRAERSMESLRRLSTLKVRVVLDVYEEEEGIFFEDHSNNVLQDDELNLLLSFPNVLITSHQAFLTHEALEEIARVTTENLLCIGGMEFLSGTRLA